MGEWVLRKIPLQHDIRSIFEILGKRRCLVGVLTKESEDNFKEMFLQVLQNEKDSDQTEKVFKYESREEKQRTAYTGAEHGGTN